MIIQSVTYIKELNRCDVCGDNPSCDLHLAELNLSDFVFTDERDAVQKKTFTKWVNKHLIKVSWESRACG